MYLIFDTESTTFPNPNLHSTSAGQAHVVQLAAILFDKDFNELANLNSLIKSDGWKISSGAQAVHGISVEQCNAEGRLMDEVMEELFTMRDAAQYRIAHNIQFDDKMMDIEWDCYIARNPDKMYRVFQEQTPICTMDLTTDICKLPFATKKTFGKKYKWPKLQEAYKHFFNEDIVGAHDALNDVRACARIFRYLKEHNMLPQYLNHLCGTLPALPLIASQ